VTTDAKEASVYDYFAYEMHKERLAQFEREAALSRMSPKRTPRRLRHLSVPLPRLRRRTQLGTHGS
jgi:hypothetical protein